MPGSIGNFFMKAMINSPLHSLLGDSYAVVTVTGRKTGHSISTPINVSRDGDSHTVVSIRDRTWWRNLRGDKPARLRVGGKTFAVRGELIEDPGAVREELQRAAEERMIIRLRPSPA